VTFWAYGACFVYFEEIIGIIRRHSATTLRRKKTSSINVQGEVVLTRIEPQRLKPAQAAVFETHWLADVLLLNLVLVALIARFGAAWLQ
jgi:hypothetical protein